MMMSHQTMNAILSTNAFDPLPLMSTPTPVRHILNKVPAGFPSPAIDHIEGRLDLTEVLINKPSATFTIRISGHSMQRAGIHDGDLAVVDRSLTAQNGDVVIAVANGELVCKRLFTKQGKTWLVPESDDLDFYPVEVTGVEDFEVWGVITSTIRFHRR